MDPLSEDDCFETVSRDDIKRELRCSVWTTDDGIALANMKRDQFKREVTDRNYKLMASLQKWEELTIEFNKEKKKSYIIHESWRNETTWYQILRKYSIIRRSLARRIGG